MRTWSWSTEITCNESFLDQSRLVGQNQSNLVYLSHSFKIALCSWVEYLYWHCFPTAFAKKKQQHRPKSPRGDSLSNRKTVPPQEDLSCVGFEEEPDLVDLCDKSGQIWVHERCAAWTLASIAAKSSVEFTVDLTNQILSKVCYFVF